MRIHRYVRNCSSGIAQRSVMKIDGLMRMLVLSISLLSVLFFNACNKEVEPTTIGIKLLSGTGLIAQDTTLKAGDPFVISLEASTEGSFVTNLYIARTFEGGTEVIVDTGIHNATFNYTRSFNKGVHSSETWIFRVKNIEGVWSSTSFTLTNLPGSNYDTVREITPITLGAQQCASNGSFFDVRNNMIYFQADAFNVQDSIELLYYYDPAGDANTISSPNANIDATIYTGASALSNWTNKNESRFYKTTINTAQYDAVVNDSLLIASYDQLNAKRKAKNLQVGDVYSFKTEHGKYGLFKILTVTGAETGTVQFSIKIQQ